MFPDERPFEEIASLPRLDENSLSIEWQLDCYDGPLSGLLAQGDNRFWFEYHSDDPESYRRYSLYRLSPADYQYLLLWRIGEDIFQNDVEPLTREPNYHDSEEFKAFLEKWRLFLDSFPKFEARTPDAWCSSGSNQSFYAFRVIRRY